MAKKIEIEEIKDKAEEAVKAARQEVEEATVDAIEDVTEVEEGIWENASGQVEELIGCNCDATDGDACSFVEDTEEIAENAKTNFENVINEAQKYVSERIDEFPTDEVKESAKNAIGTVKGALADHGIDIDVLGSKIAEDAAGLLGGFLGVVAAGANAIADAANKGAENLSAKKDCDEDCSCGCEDVVIVEDIEDVESTEAVENISEN